MNVAHPLSDLVPGAAGAVLERLAVTTQPLTGRQIARLSGGSVSQPGASRALAKLVDSGLVDVQTAGRANLYRLNRDHVLAPAVVLAVEATNALLGRVAESVGRWAPAADALWLFGSAARGDAGSESDIDLLVVRPRDVAPDDERWAEQTARLLTDVGNWSGNECGLLEYTGEELGELVAANDPLVASLRRDAVHLLGQRPGLLLRRAG